MKQWLLVCSTTARADLTVWNLFRPGVLNFDMFSASLDFFGTNLYFFSSSLNFFSTDLDITTMISCTANITCVNHDVFNNFEVGTTTITDVTLSVHRLIFVYRAVLIYRTVFIDCIMSYSLVVGLPAMLVSRLVVTIVVTIVATVRLRWFIYRTIMVSVIARATVVATRLVRLSRCARACLKNI